jgi:hypothetical protein
VERAAGGDRQARAGREAGVARHVAGRQGLGQPGEVERLEPPSAAGGLAGIERVARVGHELELRAHGRAHRLEPGRVPGHARHPDRHRAAAEPAFPRLDGALRQLLRRQGQPAGLALVERHASLRAPGHDVERQAGAAAAQVPQGGVDRGQRQRGDPSRGGTPGAGEEEAPGVLDQVRVAADQVGG